MTYNVFVGTLNLAQSVLGIGVLSWSQIVGAHYLLQRTLGNRSIELACRYSVKPVTSLPSPYTYLTTRRHIVQLKASNS